MQRRKLLAELGMLRTSLIFVGQHSKGLALDSDVTQQIVAAYYSISRKRKAARA